MEKILIARAFETRFGGPYKHRQYLVQWRLSSHLDSKMDAPPANGILWKVFKGG